MGGLTDPRVTYWEPAKWIARLRATMKGGGPVLLRTNMGAGHGGASGRFNRLDEVAIVFAFMGHPVGIGEALVIESLLHAVRGAAFAIPSALGAQEGALVVLCAAFGIPPEQAIALSLVKRAADLVLGVPGLLGWQMLEWGRLMPSYRRQPAREAVNPRSQSH